MIVENGFTHKTDHESAVVFSQVEGSCRLTNRHIIVLVSRIHMSGTFFTNMKCRMNFLTEEYTTTVQLTLNCSPLFEKSSKVINCLNRTCVIQ